MHQINSGKAAFRAAKTRSEMEAAAHGFKAGLKALANAMQFEKNRCTLSIKHRDKSRYFYENTNPRERVPDHVGEDQE